MQSYYMLMFLALANTATARLLSFTTFDIARTREQFEVINKKTLAQFSFLEENLEKRQFELKKQLNFDLQSEEEQFKTKDTKALQKAKKQGKAKDLTGIEVCIEQAQKKHLTELNVSHEKSAMCIDKATEIAKNYATNAKKTFIQTSLEGFTDAKASEHQWGRCFSPPDKECFKKINDEIDEKIAETQRIAEETVKEGKEASRIHHSVTNECVGKVQKEMADLNKNHNRVVAKCIVKPGN